MSTIVTIQNTDLITNSRTDINSNFAALNTDKIETSVIDTDTALTANSDAKIPSQKAIKAYVDALGTLSFVPTGGIMPFASATPPTGFLLCDGSAISRSTYSSLFAITSTNFGSGNGSSTFNLPDLRSRFIMGSGSAGTKVYTFVSRASDVITASGMSSSGLNENQTGQAVVYTSTGSVITGLTSTSTYYLIRISATTFSLASSLANAIAGTAITLSSDGTGTQLFTFTLSVQALGNTGGEETHGLTVAELAAHTHGGVVSSGSSALQETGAASFTYNGTTNSTGGSTAHNNTPSFIALAYIIKV